MLTNSQESFVLVHGQLHKKKIILCDVNIPYKFSLDQSINKLFFCINADEFSDQSFHSVVLDLDTGSTSIIPGIRNGFASAIDYATNTVYLGGSDGIFRYDYCTQDVENPAIVHGIDIFDMYYKNDLYYVDTATQNLFVYKNSRCTNVSEVKDYSIQHFIIDSDSELMFVNLTGLFSLPKGTQSPFLFDNSNLNYRVIAIDKNGIPHIIADNGIYSTDKKSKQLTKILSLDNGYGLAFDKDNNIIYSEKRLLIKLIPCGCT